MIYLSIFGIIGFFSFVTRNRKDLENKLFVFFLILLWLMLSFRYGQGTDYFNYKQLFYSINSLSDVIFNPNNVHSEIGFRFLYWLFGKNFEFFIFCISSFEMFMISIYIQKYSNNKMFSLFLFYPVYYLIYFFSALRQGFAIAFFVGLLYPLLVKKDYKFFLIGVLFLSLFHSSSLILIIIPFLLKIDMKKMFQLLVFSFFIGIFFCFLFDNSYVKDIAFLAKISNYWSGKISILALLNRLLYFSMIYIYLFLSKNYLSKIDDKELFEFDFKILNIGFLVYLILMGSPLIASRLMIYFQVVEIIFLGKLIFYRGFQLSTFKNYLCIFVKIIIILLIIMNCIKNVNANITQGNYKESTNIFNYPYVSIFNKDRIWDYKEKYDNILE